MTTMAGVPSGDGALVNTLCAAFDTASSNPRIGGGGGGGGGAGGAAGTATTGVAGAAAATGAGLLGVSSSFCIGTHPAVRAIRPAAAIAARTVLLAIFCVKSALLFTD